jgi:acyl-CoA-binding protein
MAPDDDFAAAQRRVRELTQQPATDELLALYGLYKQATAGDATGKRPGLLDLKGRAKFDAWASRRGQTRERCQAEYVALVDTLVKKYG